MDAAAKAEFEQRSRTLRAELKAWENEWARLHGGSKPSKADIKRNTDIERKYKQYGQVRDILSGKTRPPAPAPTLSPNKRKSTTTSTLLATPSKRTRHSMTPSKRPAHPDDINSENNNPIDELAATPAISRTLFSPAAPSSVGPTPHRDGRVLGLFDLLSPGGSAASTPTLAATPSRRREIAATRAAAQATPSRRASNDDGNDTPRPKGRRTPMSSSKRQLLDAFLTPRKSGEDKRKDSLGGPPATPTSSSSAVVSRTGVSKLQFDTPAFLRRAPVPAVDDNGDEYRGPPVLRLPRKPLGRGLSAIVAGLRKIEEDALDDDLEAMREMEADEMGMGVGVGVKQGPTPAPTDPPQGDERGEEMEENEENGHSTTDVEGILAKDRDIGLLGGFDDEGMYDGPVEQQLGRDGQPLRVYKKRGQKRTTRLARMKPVQVRRPATNNTAAFDEDEDGDGDGDGVIPEAQEVGDGPLDVDDDSGSDYEASAGRGVGPDGGGRAGKKTAAAKTRTAKAKTTKTKAKTKKVQKVQNTKKQGSTTTKKDDDDEYDKGEEDDDEQDADADTGAEAQKTTQRKVNALAHANFRRLKLRNSGSKGGPGYNSRFRRRR